MRDERAEGTGGGGPRREPFDRSRRGKRSERFSNEQVALGTRAAVRNAGSSLRMRSSSASFGKLCIHNFIGDEPMNMNHLLA